MFGAFMNLCYAKAEDAIARRSLDGASRSMDWPPLVTTTTATTTTTAAATPHWPNSTVASVQQRDPFIFLAVPSLALLSILIGSTPGRPYSIQLRGHDRHAAQACVFSVDSWPVVARGLDAVGRELDAGTAGQWRHDEPFLRQLARLVCADPDADSPAEEGGELGRRAVAGLNEVATQVSQTEEYRRMFDEALELLGALGGS